MQKFIDLPNARYLVKAAAAWLLAAVVLSLAAALIITLVDIHEDAMGYISSALSFAAAFFAGIQAMRERSRGALVCGLVVGAALITLSLTLGFIVGEGRLEPDGVLSVVTFTLSGTVAGSLLAPAGKGKRPAKAKRVRPRS